MTFDIGKTRVLFFSCFFRDMFRRRYDGTPWIVARFRYSRKGRYVNLGPITIDWSGGPWMA